MSAAMTPVVEGSANILSVISKKDYYTVDLRLNSLHSLQQCFSTHFICTHASSNYQFCTWLSEDGSSYCTRADLEVSMELYLTERQPGVQDKKRRAWRSS